MASYNFIRNIFGKDVKHCVRENKCHFIDIEFEEKRLPVNFRQFFSDSADVGFFVVPNASLIWWWTRTVKTKAPVDNVMLRMRIKRR